MRKCFPAWGVGVFTVLEQSYKCYDCGGFMHILANFVSGQSHPCHHRGRRVNLCLLAIYKLCKADVKTHCLSQMDDPIQNMTIILVMMNIQNYQIDAISK